ncbi:MAG: bifunctional UDP-N-acetylglucosamine diphosphorylase/glucosamine-1-phosphate N-acetyltransferase GlmU [Alphaproteobacteria bacterium]
MDSLAAVILAAGQGTRMKSRLPKVLHPIAGRPMVCHALAAARALGAGRRVVVVSPGEAAVAEVVRRFDPEARIVEQREPLGTGHALRCAEPALAGFGGDVLMLYADVPLVRSETLAGLVAARRARPGVALAVLGMRPAAPGAYGRLVLDAEGGLACIVEARDATEAERAIGFCNSGLIAADAAVLWRLLGAVGTANAKGEYYATDIVALARAEGLGAVAVEAAADEVVGVNDKAELARAEAAMQARLRAQALEAGVTLSDPATVWLSADTVLGRDVSIGPDVFFGPGVVIGDGVEIRAFSHLEGATVEAGATIGPFARLRPGTLIGAGARVGNFVEVKAATLGPGAKLNHLSYVGDAEIGAGANIGAGTITCNYDGFAKSRTEIGPGAFIGSNSALVAPIRIGAGAVVGAGSTIVEDVPDDAIAVARGEQKVRPGAAAKRRAKRKSAEG